MIRKFLKEAASPRLKRFSFNLRDLLAICHSHILLMTWIRAHELAIIVPNNRVLFKQDYSKYTQTNLRILNQELVATYLSSSTFHCYNVSTPILRILRHVSEHCGGWSALPITYSDGSLKPSKWNAYFGQGNIVWSQSAQCTPQKPLSSGVSTVQHTIQNHFLRL